MSREIKNTIILVCIAIYIIVYKLFLFTNFMKQSSMFTASFLVALVTLSIYFLGYRKNKSDTDEKYVMKIVVCFLLLFFIAMYGLGFFTGFLKNGYSLSFWTLISNIFAPIIIITLTELFRYIVIWANRDKKIVNILLTIALILLEITISIRSIPFNDLELLFRTATTTLIPIIIKNCVLSYLCYHIGYRPTLVYRLAMDIYFFVVPIVPNLGDYLQSMFLIALPLITYINISSYFDDREKKANYTFEDNSFSILDIPVTVILVVLAALVSGVFPHYMIGVGSESMSPTINKGDAIILKKVNSKTELEKGDIIAFQKDDKIIVHRIEEVTVSNGKRVYITKGDANKEIDTNVVTSKQVQGLVQTRIPIIAYPTIWFTDFIKDRG